MDDAGSVAARVVTALDAAGLRAAIGGALALGWWARPRATLDADINVFCSPPEHAALVGVLMSLGARPYDADPAGRLDAGDAAFFDLGGTRVDIFAPSIPFYAEAAGDLHDAMFGGVPVRVLGPYSLAVFKLLFFRPKDLNDLEELYASQRDMCQPQRVEAAIAAMLGEDDPRIAAWRRIVAGAP
jgi:hypothetical protein